MAVSATTLVSVRCSVFVCISRSRCRLCSVVPCANSVGPVSQRWVGRVRERSEDVRRSDAEVEKLVSFHTQTVHGSGIPVKPPAV